MTAIFQTTITLSDAVKALVRIVQEVGPEHKASNNGSNGCTYFTTDEHRLNAVCIVGRYLSDLGVLRATLDPDNAGQPDGICNAGFEIWERLAAMGVTVEPDAQVFLRKVQAMQDDGATWAVAVARAIEKMEEMAVNKARDDFAPLRALSETLPVVPQTRNHDALVFVALDDTEVMHLVATKKNIPAIKRLRVLTSANLLDAKNAIMDPRVQGH